MKKITKKELKEILEQHKLWLDSNEKEGKRADLTNANLYCADLAFANLTGADLTGVDLAGADLSGSDLSGSNLAFANLTDAGLTGANLTRADLTNANLYCADLTNANLYCADLANANLRRADLSDADLTGASLTGADLTGATLTDTIIDEKEQCRKGIVLTEPIVGYKKSNEGKIITLEIPIGAKVFSIHNDKRRTNKCKVIDMQGETVLSSFHYNDFKYHVGDVIEIEDFDARYNVECSTGIHFFLTRDEAEQY